MKSIFGQTDRLYKTAVIAFLLAGRTLLAGETNPSLTLHLARSLSEEGAHLAAAIEYRRLSLEAADMEEQAGFGWMAAYEYHLAGEQAASEKILDMVESKAHYPLLPSLLLRAENARLRRAPREAEFFLQAIHENPVAPLEMQLYAARRSAALAIAQKNFTQAEKALCAVPEQNQAGLQAVAAYRTGHNKRPLVGGFLGMVPGLGYAYSGEYANAVRSLLLNSLFIFGMWHTAEQDQWGAFGVITFFEITWYSGSIYGGIDAAHRYNRQRLENCQEQIMGNAAFTPEPTRLPIITLKFRF